LASPTPTTEPHQLFAGDSWKWDKTLANYPASDGWQLSYAFRGETDYDAEWGTEVTSPSGSDGFEIRIPSADTDLPPGAYKLYGRVTDGTEVETPIEVKLNILANPATAVGSKSFNATVLAAIESAISGTVLTAQQKRVRINGREIENFDPEDLEKWHAHYKHLVEIERNPTARLSQAGRFTNAR
jgi:hypothetical protein